MTSVGEMADASSLEVFDSLEQLRDRIPAEFHDALVAALDRHRNKVTRHFEQVFAAPQTDQGSHPLTAVCCGTADADTSQALLENAGYDDPQRVLATLDALHQSTARLAESTQLRLNALLPPAPSCRAAGMLPSALVTLTRRLPAGMPHASFAQVVLGHAWARRAAGRRDERA